MRSGRGLFLARFSVLAVLLFSSLPGEAQNIPALERRLTKRAQEYFQLLVTGD